MLPRRLPPVLPTPLFVELCTLHKRCRRSLHHSESPRHAFAHCGGFAAAAPRRARALVSVPFWGLPLPWPLGIIGLVGRYPTNNHNPTRSHPKADIEPIPYAIWEMEHSSIHLLSGIILSFPRLSPSLG